MPALNFQARFASDVESGRKRQTIRAYRKDGRDPKPGDTLYLYTGMRTKACRKLGEVRCCVAMPFALSQRGISGNVNMTCGNGRRVTGEARFRVASLHDATRERFVRIARADGFDSPEEMVEWFEKAHGLPFRGVLVRW